MNTRSFFDGVLIGLAIDLPPFFLVDDGAEFGLRTLLLLWGALAGSGVALYVARETRLGVHLPNKTMVSFLRVKACLRPARQRASANETDASSPASHQGN